MKALVTSENDKYSVEEVTIDPPKAGELSIKMSATGVCRSDLSVINGTIPLPKPIVLGHEGAGIVDGLGEGVTDFAVGDPVVLSFNPACGSCFFCEKQEPQFCSAGAPNGLMRSSAAWPSTPSCPRSARRRSTPASPSTRRPWWAAAS